MNNRDEKSPAQRPPRAGRADRLAQQLRVNLKRRKAQARGRAVSFEGPQGVGDGTRPAPAKSEED